MVECSAVNGLIGVRVPVPKPNNGVLENKDLEEVVTLLCAETPPTRSVTEVHHQKKYVSSSVENIFKNSRKYFIITRVKSKENRK